MNSLEIAKLCQSKCFLGVFPSDLLPKPSYPSCFIANTEPNGTKGEHWVAIFINKEGYGDYFCSFGKIPQPEFVHFMNSYTVSWNYNQRRIQAYFSLACGPYCIFFLFCRTRGMSMAKFMSLFGKNSAENDSIVQSFIITAQRQPLSDIRSRFKPGQPI